MALSSAIIDWFLDRPGVKVELKTAMYWLIYPIVYCVYTLIRGPIVGWYPYYFLSPIKMKSYEGVELMIAGLTLFFMALILLAYYLHNKFADTKVA
ncbi:MAG: Pr6Pr family membrane protein [Candidatus Margulisbacteria bacterium]|nr:Pr6Pr family membrane protein [Candidatus Margulisiibacteriota bacterium]